MRRLSRRILCALAAGFMSAAGAQSASPAPCSSSAHREFDFWLGEWNVHAAQGKLAGTNSVTREYGGCVVHERYTTGKGYSGESLNIYDASRKTWHQTWVDSSGLLLRLEGGLQQGAMVLQGQTTTADGKSIQHRITWTPRPDGSVRQVWETTRANGEWQVAFDGLYTRR